MIRTTFFGFIRRSRGPGRFKTTSTIRTADALNLACAAEHGFDIVYFNDRLVLAAVLLFGLKGVNVILPSDA